MSADEKRSSRTPGPHGSRLDDEATPLSDDPEAAVPASSEPASAAEPRDAELRDRWLRAEADLQNYRRRAQRDLEESVRFAENRILLEMIAQLDDLERALATAREAEAPDSWVQGVRMVANRMVDDLARHDVVPMGALGERFDPEQHEALLEVDAPEGVEPGRIVQVVREGYRRGDRPLRAARVVVAGRPGEPR